MTIMPGVEWRPSPNFSSPVQRPPRGIVLHTADGSYGGTITWQDEARSQVSSYFATAQDGRVAQCVDTDRKAWTQGTGNEAWIGIENEGHGELGQALTAAQVETIAHVYAWLVRLYPSVPVQITDDPNGAGLGWHGMGAAVGWGHPSCPDGDTHVIRNQRPQIIARTKELLGAAPVPVPTPKKVSMQLFKDDVHAGIDGNHPRCASLQDGGAIALGNGANIQGRTAVKFGNGFVIPSDLPGDWEFKGSAEVRDAQGRVIGFRYEATDAAGQWHPYVYYFAA